MHQNTDRESPSSAAHAINNYLTVVIGLADLLEMRLHNGDDANAIQIVCQIRVAAFDAARATKPFSGEKCLEAI